MISDPVLARLRAHARLTTLCNPTTLGSAVTKLGFVQADPIRAPARAQDLILRHRVTGYRAGDLERAFARSELEEDFLYAYGFTTRETAALIHPRPDLDGEAGVHGPSGLAAEVLAFVRAHGPTHPADLEERFGRERAVNGWGGFSKATTRALESLHHYGLLRVARRRDGIRIYEATTRPAPTAGAAERAHALVMLVARILAPVSTVSLRGALALMARRNPGLGPLAPVVAAALRTGELERQEVDGESYLWPTFDGAPEHRPAPRDVRLLAPLTPWFGIAAASSTSGAGPIASRPTPRHRGGSSGTTPCRCSGVTTSSAGPTSAWPVAGWRWRSATCAPLRAAWRSVALSMPSLPGWSGSWRPEPWQATTVSM